MKIKSKRRRIDYWEIKKIIKMRGLGYSQNDISKVLKLSQSAIAYQLKRINTEAKKQGMDKTWKKYFPSVRVMEVDE